MDRTVLIHHQLLGDGLMATPAIREIRKKLPSTKIVLVVGPEAYQNVWENNPHIDTIMYLKDPQLQAIKDKYAFTRGRLTVLSEYERACILDCGQAFNWCTGHPKLVNDIVSNKVRTITPHFAHGFAKQLGVTVDNTHYDVCLRDSEVEEGRKYLRNKYGDNVILVACLSRSCSSRHSIEHPGEPNKPANKMWEPSNWNKVIKTFAKDFTFVALGSANEPTIDVNVKWELGLDIRLVAAMCKEAKCLVAIDGGIGHLAAAVDANIVSLCAAVPYNLVGVSHGHGKCIAVDHSQETNGPYGIASITSDEVISAIRKVVA